MQIPETSDAGRYGGEGNVQHSCRYWTGHQLQELGCRVTALQETVYVIPGAVLVAVQ